MAVAREVGCGWFSLRGFSILKIEIETIIGRFGWIHEGCARIPSGHMFEQISNIKSNGVTTFIF